MLQVALVGAWHVHFNQYAQEVSGREDCTVTALWDDDEARGRDAAQQYDCVFEPDYDKLLAREDVEAVVIASATNQHVELIGKAAEAGKHIFTEKVLCFTTGEAEELRNSVKENNIQFCISFPWRTRRELMYAKKVLDEGILGEVTYARVRNAHNGASKGWLPDHFFDEKACGGGAMMDLGTHPMYLLTYLLGKPNAVTSVFTYVTGREVEDNAVTIMEFENVIACAETGFVSSNDPFFMQLSGTLGTLYWGGAQDGVVVNTGEGFIAADSWGEQMKKPIDQWVDGILYGGKIEFGIDDAVMLTKVMEAAYQSFREHNRVAL